MIHFWWPSRGPRLPQPADHRCATVPDEDLFDHVRLGRFDERHHRHLAAALGATQWVYFVDPLDQHGPGLAATRSCGGSAVLTLARWLGGCFRRRLLPHPPRLVGVPAIVPNQMRTLPRYVSVTFTSLDKLNGQRVMYWVKRSIPAWSPAGSRTDWSTLNPECSHERMFSTTSGAILSSARYRLKTASCQAASRRSRSNSFSSRNSPVEVNAPQVTSTCRWGCQCNSSPCV